MEEKNKEQVYTAEIIQFSPVEAEISTNLEKSKMITITDFSDKKQVEAVHNQRMIWVKCRTTIEKFGKAKREDATEYCKRVIAKEKELIKIFADEELRLDRLEDEAKQFQEMEARKAKLPERQKAIAEIEPDSDITDEELLAMSDKDFAVFLQNKSIQIERAKIEAERQKLAEERKIQEEEANRERIRLQIEAKERRDKEEAELEIKRRENAEKEAEIKRQQDAINAEKKRIADEEQKKLEEQRQKEQQEKKRIEDERLAKEKADKEAKEREASDKFNAWLASNGVTADNKHEYHYAATSKKLWKLVAEYKE